MKKAVILILTLLLTLSWASISLAQGPAQFQQLIKGKKVAKGMTLEMVLKSWGEPDSKSRTETCWGIEEKWVYKNRPDLGISGQRVLTFLDGKLNEIE